MKVAASALFKPHDDEAAEAFVRSFCVRCIRRSWGPCATEKAWRQLPTTSPDYPSAMRLNPRGNPTCTDYVPTDEEPKYRCPQTLELDLEPKR